LRLQSLPYLPSASLSAVSAYRKDMEKRKGPLGKDDGAWIAISTLVGQIGSARGGDRRRILDEAAGMAAELFDPATLAYGCAFDPPPVDRRSSIAVVRLLAERIEDCGSLHLAMSLMNGLRGVLPAESPNAGRVLAQRARLTWKMGDATLALARYRHLNRKSRTLKSGELLMRSWAGYVAVAQLRGNYPDVRRWAQKVVQRAEAGHMVRLASLGHHGLMVGHAVACEFSDAIKHGWQAYRGRDGDRTGQLEMLSNIGRLFHDAGDNVSARSAFVRVLAARPMFRIGASALGGYALASAALGDEDAVRWAAEESSSLLETAAGGYETASALIDCANALEVVGDLPYGSVLRARGSTIAQYAGYHEVVHKSHSRSATSKPNLSPPALLVAEEIDRLPKAELPDHLELIKV
jgi:hypothetical protein